MSSSRAKPLSARSSTVSSGQVARMRPDVAGAASSATAAVRDSGMDGARAADTGRAVGQRVFGIIDPDDLHRDPVLGAVLGRLEAKRPGLGPLAGWARRHRRQRPAGRGDRSALPLHQSDRPVSRAEEQCARVQPIAPLSKSATSLRRLTVTVFSRERLTVSTPPSASDRSPY